MSLQGSARLASRQLLKTCIPNPMRTMCRSSSQFTVEHEIAVKGFGKGTNDFYDKARPSYPSPAIKYVQSRVSPSESSQLDVVELGSGTGIFSRLLLAPPDKDATAFASKTDQTATQGSKEYPDWSIRSSYAVEPSDGMRQTWQNGIDKLRQANPDITKAADGSEREIVTLNGGFSDLAELKERRKSKGLPEEGWADAVMAAQAWHWAHPKYDEAVREIATILKPGGKLVFIWNNEVRDPPYSQDYRDYELGLENDTPQQRRGLWEAMFDTPAYKEFFEPSLGDGKGERRWFEWKRVVNDQAMLDRTFSKSYVVARSDQEKEKIKEDLSRFLKEWQGQEWVDKEAGTYLLTFRTLVVIMQRK